jgi:hypothetical protein
VRGRGSRTWLGAPRRAIIWTRGDEVPKCDSMPLPTASSAFAMSLTRYRLLGMVGPLWAASFLTSVAASFLMLPLLATEAAM